jgi:hypothetical protein
MKKLVIVFLALLINVNIQAETLKPYILGAVCSKSLTEAKVLVKQNLKDAGFNILGEYKPAGDANRWLIVVSNNELISAVKKEGGLRGFAASLRVALTVENSKINVTYTNPYYWGNAYFGDDFPKVAVHYNKVNTQFIAAMKKSGVYKGSSFGSEKGVDLDDVRDYQYMFGMPEFDDVVNLAEFDSYAAAKTKVESNLKKGVSGLKLVYSIEVPGSKLKLYGIALTSTEGEKKFLPKIDLGTPKHTAFLPYEILVNDDEVIMLHGRYRIALSFPDLAMSTFSKIMSTPGEIEDAMKKACE